MIFIVALNPQDARACARNHGLDPRTWRYLTDPHSIKGCWKQTAWLVDGFANRPNAEDLLRALDARDFTVVNRSINKKGAKSGPDELHDRPRRSDVRRISAERSRNREAADRDLFAD